MTRKQGGEGRMEDDRKAGRRSKMEDYRKG
jgi:hypothetical protein